MHEIVDDVELHERRRAHAVHDDDDLVAFVIDVREDLVEQLFRDLVCGQQLLTMRAWLAVDADADLHLVLFELKARLAGGWHRARLNGHAHGADVRDDFFRRRLDLLERRAFLCACARELVDKDRASHAAAPCRERAVLDGDIIVDDDVIRFDVLIFRHIDGHLEVHDIARVVLHDAEHARVRRNGLDALIDHVRRRRCEYGSCDRRIEHALAYEAAMRGLMPRAATRHKRNFPLLALLAHDNIARFELRELQRARLHETLDHFLFDIFDRVDDFLHDGKQPPEIKFLEMNNSDFFTPVPSIPISATKFKRNTTIIE